MTVEAVRGIQRESEPHDWTLDLGEAPFPVLLLRGGAEGRRVDDELAREILKRARDSRELVLPRSSHDLSAPEKGPLVSALSEFLITL